MFPTPRFEPSRFWMVLLGFVILNACDGREYLDGTPPLDAKLFVTEITVDTIGDSAVGRTVRVRFRSDWEIDSAEFSKNQFVFGVELMPGHDQWFTRPLAIALAAARGSRLDTLSCTGSVCHYPMWPVAHVLMQLPDGRYLSVANDSLKLAFGVGP